MVLNGVFKLYHVCVELLLSLQVLVSDFFDDRFLIVNLGLSQLILLVLLVER